MHELMHKTFQLRFEIKEKLIIDMYLKELRIQEQGRRNIQEGYASNLRFFQEQTGCNEKVKKRKRKKDSGPKESRERRRNLE